MHLQRVALLIDRNPGYQEQLLRGIRRYTQAPVPWLCQAIRPDAGLMDHVRAFKPHGVILGTSEAAIRQQVLKLGRPAVEVFNWLPRISAMPRIVLDDIAVGRLAAAHFLERGFRSFAFIRGRTGAEFVRLREKGFANEIRACGLGHVAYVQPAEEEEYSPGVMWRDGGPALRAWVKRLPDPVAVFAATDAWALRLLETCRKAEVQVPEQVAVVGVDDDDIFCLLAQPPLSSVATGAVRVGHAAAALLDRLMAGEMPPSHDLLLQPPGVVTRHSSDAIAVADPDVATVLRMIHHPEVTSVIHSNSPRTPADILRIDVNHLVAAVAVPRRTLERRFRAVIGRGMAEEIRRVRLDRAKRFLVTSDASMPEIAIQAGYASAAKLSADFRQSLNTTPSAYRRNFHATDAR